MQQYISFLKIIDHQTIIVSILAIASTFVCHHFELAANMPSGLIGIAVIFPIVFSINAAYKRREEALRNFAAFKGYSVALFFAHRDWAVTEEGLQDANRLKSALGVLLQNINNYFLHRGTDKAVKLEAIYDIFSTVSKANEDLRKRGIAGGELSRINQYLKELMNRFEQMRNILIYRTPISLRAYSSVFLNGFPILFGPYFAYLIIETSALVGYLVAVLYSLVLVSLDNIQEDLENPFDAVGEDDINLDISEKYLALMEVEQSD